MTTRYFTSNISEALFRRVSGDDQLTDQIFLHDTWVPTDKIMQWMTGNADDVDEITEAKARKLEPTAFT